MLNTLVFEDTEKKGLKPDTVRLNDDLIYSIPTSNSKLQQFTTFTQNINNNKTLRR